MIDENRKFDRPGVVPARDFLVRLGIVTGLLTTNYDLLVEYALGTKKMNYGEHGEVLTGRGSYPSSQWSNPVTLVGSVSVAKMHGSVSWDENARYTDGRRGLTGEVLIVAPTAEKSVPNSLRRAWDLSAHILGRSDRLVVFGFGSTPTTRLYSNILPSTVGAFVMSPSSTFAPTLNVSRASGREPPLSL